LRYNPSIAMPATTVVFNPTGGNEERTLINEINEAKQKPKQEEMADDTKQVNPAQRLYNYYCPSVIWAKNNEAANECPYQQAIGALMWPSCVCRPDITYAVNLLARFTSNPSKEHWTGVKHVSVLPEKVSRSRC